jgi:hypothetical protein
MGFVNISGVMFREAGRQKRWMGRSGESLLRNADFGVRNENL